VSSFLLLFWQQLFFINTTSIHLKFIVYQCSFNDAGFFRLVIGLLSIFQIYSYQDAYCVFPLVPLPRYDYYYLTCGACKRQCTVRERYYH
jgi:hypothetical protein